jgi:hypothetical protein
MRKISAIILLTIGVIQIHCQNDTIKVGAYRNILEFNRQIPFYPCHFTFVNVNHDEIPELYNVFSNDKSVNIKNIDNTIWCIYDGNDFYLNAQRIGMTSGYIRFDTLKRYSYFKGIPIKSISQQARIKKSATSFGVRGLIVTGAIVKSENKNNTNYVFNKRNGMVNVLTKDYLITILNSYPDLLAKFQLEGNMDSLNTWLKYLDLIDKGNK